MDQNSTTGAPPISELEAKSDVASTQVMSSSLGSLATQAVSNTPDTSISSSSVTANPESLDNLKQEAIDPLPPTSQPRSGRKITDYLHNPWLRAVTAVLSVVLILFSVGLGVSKLGSNSIEGNKQYQPTEVSPIPEDTNPLDEADFLAVNGQLQINNSLIISPSDEPSNPVLGQVYMDQRSEQLYYYTSAGKQPLSTTVSGLQGEIGLGAGLTTNDGNLVNSGVISVQGQSGAVVFQQGDGVEINGLTIANTGVLSLQGRTGEVALSAGNGIAISGLQIRNDGVVTLNGGSANISVTDDGSGNFVITDLSGGASGEVALGPEIAQEDSSDNSSININKTGTGNLLQFAVDGTDEFVVSSSGAITSGSISFNQVTSKPSFVNTLIGTANQVNVSSSSGSVTLSLPQSIASSSSPAFAGIDLTSTSLSVADGGHGIFGANPSQGQLLIGNGGGGFTLANLTHDSTIDITNGGGTIFLSVPLVDQCSQCADNTLDNLVNVAINTTLLPGLAGNVNLGSASLPFGTLTLAGSSASAGSNNFTLTGVATAGRTVTLPDASGTVCYQNNASCGFASAGSYVTLQSTTGTPQTGNINISDRVTAGNFNGLVLTQAANQFSVTGGTGTSRILTVNGNSTINQDLSTTSNTVQFGRISALSTKLEVTQGGTGLGSSPTTGQLLIGNSSGGYALNTLTAGTGVTIDSSSSPGNITISSPSAGTCSTCANTSLSNISSVSIPSGSHLLPTSANTVDLGSGARAFRDLYLGNSTNSFRLTGVASGSNKTLTLQNISGTVVLAQSAGSSTAQSGDVSVDNAFIAPKLQSADTVTASTNSSALSIRSGNASGSTSNSGNLTIDSGSATTSTGTITIAGTNASGLTLGRSGLQASLPGGLTTSGSAISTGGGNLSLVSGTITTSGTISSGAINGQTISSGANLTGTLSIGTSTTTTGAISLKNASNSNTITLQSGATSGNLTFTLPSSDGSSGQCLSTNGSGVLSFVGCSGSVTGTGTAGAIAKWTDSNTLADSILTESGTTVTVGGTLAVNTITPTASLTVGSTGLTSLIQGSNVQLAATNSGITNTLEFATPASANKTITLPNRSGTVAVAATGIIQLSADGVISCPTCGTSSGGISQLNSLTASSIDIQDADGNDLPITGSDIIYIPNASDIVKGLAKFNATNFNVSTPGTINTIQNINTSAAPQFASATLTAASSLTLGTSITSGNVGSIVFRDGTAGALTNTLTTAAVSGSSKTITLPNASGTVAVSASGNIALSASGDVSFTGQLPITNGGTGASTASGARSNLGSAASGANSDITSLTGLTTALGTQYGGTGTDTSSALAGAALLFNSSTQKFEANRFTSNDGSIDFTFANGNVNFRVESCATCANTSLTNLSGVAIQGSSLLTGQSGIDLGSATAAFRDAYLYGSGTYGSHSIRLTGAPSDNRTLTLPDASGTVCISTNNCNYQSLGSYVVLSPGSPQSGYIDVDGNISAATFSGLTLAEDANGFTVTGGTSPKILSVTGDSSLNQHLLTSSTAVQFGGLTVGSTGLTVNGNVQIANGQTLTVNTVAPASGQAFALGSTGASQTTLLQGNSISFLNGSHTYTFNSTAAGSHSICDTSGNCAGAGGGVTSTGGTSGYLAKFNGSTTLANSGLFENSTGVGLGTNDPQATLHVVGTQATSTSGNGSAGSDGLKVVAAKGQDTTGTSGQAAGTGGAINLISGAGGNAPSGSTNGNGGNVTLQGGAAGSGTGTAGSYGNVLLQTNGGKVGIKTSVPANLVSVGVLSTSNATTDKAQVAISTGGTTNVGLLIQGVSGQTGTGYLIEGQDFNGTPTFAVRDTGEILTLSNITGSAALTLSSGGGGNLTLDSSSDILQIAATDSIIRRVASGTTHFEMNDSSNTTLELRNQGAGIASLRTEGFINLGTLATSTSGSVQLCRNADDFFLVACDSNSNNVVTLQTAYNAGVGGAVPEIQITSGDGAVTIQDTLLGQAGNIFEIKNGSGIDTLFGVDSSGITSNINNTTTALQLTDGGDTLFTVDTTNNRVTIGGGSADIQFIVDSVADEASISGSINGAIVYDSTEAKFKCRENSVWTNCIGGSSTVSLQSAYNVGSAVTTNTTGGTMVFNVNSNGGFETRFSGASVLGVTGSTGDVTIQDQSTASTTFFTIKDNSNTTLLAADGVDDTINIVTKLNVNATGATAAARIVGANQSTPGANALPSLWVTSGTGGASADSSGATAGIGANITLTSGTGGTGNCTLVCSANGGAGGAVTIQGGTGGSGDGVNGNGGNVIVQGGATGGGAGTAGSAGNVLLARDRGNVILGSFSANSYKLEVVANNNNPQVRVGASGVDAGGYLGSISSASVMLSGGVAYDAATDEWIAKETFGSGLFTYTGNVHFFTGENYTIGTAADINTPLKLWANGKVGLGSGATPSAIVHVNNGGFGTNLFTVTDSHNVGVESPIDIFNLADQGAASFRNQANSTSAFKIQNADASQTLFNVDTSNSVVGVGQGMAANPSQAIGAFSVYPNYDAAFITGGSFPTQKWLIGAGWKKSDNNLQSVFGVNGRGMQTLIYSDEATAQSNLLYTTNSTSNHTAIFLNDNDTINTQGYIGYNSNPGSNNYLYLGVDNDHSTSDLDDFKLQVGEDAVAFASNTSGDSMLVDATTDRVTINTASANGSPATGDKLNVGGDIRVGTGTTGCLKDADGTVLAGTCSSDSRLKKNISSISDVLSAFSQLDVVNYEWRADEFPEYGFGTATQTGLIAQDVEALFPQLVSVDANGYKQLDYSGLSLLNIKATTELSAKVNGQGQRISALEEVTGSGANNYIQNNGDANLSSLNVSGNTQLNELEVTGTAQIDKLEVTGEATFAGNLTVNGHIRTGGSAPVAIAQPGAGEGATCEVDGNDTSGQVTIRTGSGGWIAGVQCRINFFKDFTKAPRPVITLANAVDTSDIQPYVDSASGYFTINFLAASPAERVYKFNYFNVE